MTLLQSIDEAQTLIKDDQTDRALDIIFDKVNDDIVPQSALAHTMLAQCGFNVGGEKEGFAEMDEVFRTLKVEDYDLVLHMGLLTTTCQCKDKFSHRIDFVTRIRAYGFDHTPDEMNILLKGIG